MYSHPFVHFLNIKWGNVCAGLFLLIWKKICMFTLGARGCLVSGKCQKVKLRIFMWSRYSVIALCIVVLGQTQKYFFNFMLSVFLSNDYTISFIFTFKLSSTNGQMTVAPFVANSITVTMWLKVSNLFCSVPYLEKNI